MEQAEPLKTSDTADFVTCCLVEEKVHRTSGLSVKFMASRNEVKTLVGSGGELSSACCRGLSICCHPRGEASGLFGDWEKLGE